jgi:hypothetical protein
MINTRAMPALHLHRRVPPRVRPRHRDFAEALQVVVFAGSYGANLALEAAMAGVPITKLALHEPHYRVEGYPKPADDFMDNLWALPADGKCGEAAEYFLAELNGSWAPR